MKLKLLLALTILLSSINVFNSARAIDVKTVPEITPQGQQLHQERSLLSQQANQKTQEKETISTLFHNWSAPISAVVTLAGVLLAINEYKRGEKWKRREYLDKKFQEFESKPETINVRKMLINQVQIVELFPAAPDPKNKYALINSGILIKALKKQIPKDEYDHLNKAMAETEKNGKPCKDVPALVEAAIRDNFNMFLQYLQQFEIMILSKTVDRDDLKIHLEPWIEIIKNIGQSEFCNLDCKTKVLEYMGLCQDTQVSDLTPVQKNIRNLFTQNCSYELQDYQGNTKSCNQKLEHVLHHCHQTVIPD